MKNEFIPYAQALELKELGFDEPCFATFYKKELSQYPNSREEETGFNITPFELVKNTEVVGLIADTITAPTFSQAFRFFREKYDLDVISKPHIRKTKKYVCDPVNIRLEAKNTYEEAELECLKKLIQIIKEKL